MTDSLFHRFDRRSSRAGLAFLFVLLCVVLVPEGFLWTGPVAAGLFGLTLATALVLGRRAISSRPQPITGLEAPSRREPPSKGKPMEGKALAVGNGRVLEDGTKVALDVRVGDRFLFGKYSGNEIKTDGEEVVIAHENEVLAIMG
jgi:co-chaperonin GroES (HSP10)